MKKIVILITVFALLLTSMAYGANVGFTDVKENDWFYDVLNEVVDRGIIDGYPDGTFKPQNNITRAEFTKVIVVALELKIVAGNAFVDTEGHWADDVINTALEGHIISRAEHGYSYEPDKKITRIEMAKMVVRALGFEKDADSKACEKTKFLDNFLINDEDKGYVILASENGVINGYPDKTFKPNGKATRAEAAQMLVNMLNVVEGDDVEDARTEEGFIDTSLLEKVTFEDYGLSDAVRDILIAINRATGEAVYEPGEIVEINKSMLPVKFADIIIEDYYRVKYDDSVLPDVYSLYWGLGARYDMFIIEGRTMGEVDVVDYAAAFLDEDSEVIKGMSNKLPCYNFSASDKGTQIVVGAYPNMAGTSGKIGEDEEFTFIFLETEKKFDQVETVILRTVGWYGTKTDDVLVFSVK